MATNQGTLNSTTGAIVSSSSGALPPGGAPRHVAPVILSFDAANYTKWSIYMRASLGRAGLLGHVDGTVAATPTDAADRKSTRLNSSHITRSRMPSSA